jgi:hypothetical protein
MEKFMFCKNKKNLMKKGEIITPIFDYVAKERSLLNTGKLTENVAEECRQKIVKKADHLNQVLELDLVVRDLNLKGLILQPGR